MTDDVQDFGQAPSGAPEQKAERPRPSWLPWWLVPGVFLVLVGSLGFVFHGLTLHLHPWSQALVNGIVKYTYKPTGQEQTTVVLFREDHLRDLGIPYPVPYDVHALVLEKLAEYKPGPVFVDFAFVEDRPDVDKLVDAIAALCESGASVFIATASAARQGQTTSIRELVQTRMQKQQKPSNQQSEKNRLDRCAVLVSSEIGGFHGVSGVLTYPHGTKTTAGKYVPSAAFALARDTNNLQDNLKVDPDDANGLEIIWGKGVPPLNKEWMKCSDAGEKSILKRFLHDGPLAVRLNCPYNRTISVDHLLSDHLLNQLGREQVSQALHGKTILYGADFHFTGERVFSPVYKDLPGVYAHAMAYDNLVTFGANYKRESHWRKTVFHFFLLLAAVGVIVRYGKPDPDTKEPPWKIVLILGLGLLIYGLLYWRMRDQWPPGGAVLSGVVFLLVVWVGLRLGLWLEDRKDQIGIYLAMVVAGFIAFAAWCAAFVVVINQYGLDEALLLVFVPGYVAYKLFVKGDLVFVVVSVVLLAASLLAYLPPFNLGPLNILAFLIFFELARHAREILVHIAEEYFKRRGDPLARQRNGLGWRLSDGFFRSFVPIEKGEMRHGT